jgi:hypothetical protein
MHTHKRKSEGKMKIGRINKKDLGGKTTTNKVTTKHNIILLQQ